MRSPESAARSIRWGFAVLGLALAAACSKEQPRVEPLRLEWIRPRNVQGVFLNEDLVFTFSEEVDPLSVIRMGIHVHDSDGLPARGNWFVEGVQVRFAPAEVLARDLSDGGYRPGTRYEVEVLGFPRVDAVRGLDGRPLERSYRWSFETVSVASDRSGLVFEDASPASAQTIRPAQRLPWIGPEGPVLVQCDEPIDPSSIRDDEFLFVPYLEGRESAPNHEPTRSKLETVPVRAVLVQNLDEADRAPGEPCAVIELYPSPGPLAPGPYSLRFARPLSLRDFGGNTVAGPGRSDRTDFRVIEPGAEGDRSQLHLAFLEPRWSAPFELPGTDGTAHWNASGRLEIQFPRAAGEGTDGNVVLGTNESRRDVQATRLFLPAGTRCVLEGPGLRVLRAQGKVVLSGELVRPFTEPCAKMVVTRDMLENHLRNAPSRLMNDWLWLLPGPAGTLHPFHMLSERLAEAILRSADRPLSNWLDRAFEDDSSWTVIIAGGDLTIDGSVRVDTPLLLVAGGRIRTYGDGKVRAAEKELMLLGQGGGWNLDPTATSADLLFLDAPVMNPLRVRLRYGILSEPLPASAHVTRWRNAEADGWPRSGQRAPVGSWSVRYLPAEGSLERARTVDHPAQIAPSGPIRLWIELDVEPGGVWNPPFLDYVQLSWEEQDR